MSLMRLFLVLIKPLLHDVHPKQHLLTLTLVILLLLLRLLILVALEVLLLLVVPISFFIVPRLDYIRLIR